MNIWILANHNRTDTNENNRFIQEAKKLNHKLAVFTSADFPKDQTPDHIFTRTSNLETLQLTKDLQKNGAKIFNNPGSIKMASHKFKTYQQLKTSDLPTPETTEIKPPFSDAKIKNLKYPVIIKAAISSMGRGVHLAQNSQEFHDAVKSIQHSHKNPEILLQEYIPESRGRDLRILVLDHKPLAAILRTSDTDFKANCSKGANATHYELTPEITKLVTKTTKLFDLRFAGIDLLFTKTGYTICEINPSPNFQYFEKATEINVAKAVIEAMI